MKVNLSTEDPATLADPLAPVWSDLEAETVPLSPAPTDNQPSNYIRIAYSGREIGAVREVQVQVAECNGELIVRLTWDDETPEREHRENTYPDAAAVMFPLRDDAPLTSMGSEDQPVAVWYWRPDLDFEAEELIASGLGTVERVKRVEGANPLTGRSAHEAGRWNVVLRRAQKPAGDDRADVTGEGAAKLAVAVWEGSAGERGGFKTVSEGWRELDRDGDAT